MKRKAIALISTLVFLGTTPAFAATDDVSAKNPVNVEMDGQYIYDDAVPNFLLNNKTVVPLKAFADAMGAFVQSDGSNVVLIKPNVNLVVSDNARVNDSGNRFSIAPFSAVSVGQSITPHLYYMVDNAPITDSLNYKIVVEDPSGKEIYSSSVNTISTVDKGPGFVGILTLDELTFDKSGNYKVQLLMRIKSGSYLNVGQTIIRANE